MTRPTLLDLFCGAGGAGEGYHRAGFDVTGVDIKPQRHHPAHMRFVQADALEYAMAEGWRYDAIHASPPCQAFSSITPKHTRHLHVNLIPQTRFVLETLGAPYIIENVEGARRALRNPVMLCGTFFDLKVYRHRLFESNVYLMQPQHVPHRDNAPGVGRGASDKGFITVTSSGNPTIQLKHGGSAGIGSGGTYGMSDKGFVSVTGHMSGVEYCRFAMGIDWMPRDALGQAIPPAYTEYLGRQLMQYVLARREGGAA